MTRNRLGRRSFTNYLLGGGLLTTLSSILIPIINFMIPPKAEEAGQNSVEAARVGELGPNSGKTFRFGTQPGILVCKDNGEYVAFSAICSHLDCTVQYRDDFKHIWCACHNGHFDLAGRNISGPPPDPLEVYDVGIVGDAIVVTRKS